MYCMQAVPTSSWSTPRRNVGAATPTYLQYHNCIYGDTTGTASVVFNWPTMHQNSQIPTIILSPPIPLRLYTLPYWSNPPFLIFDIRALWRPGLSARAPECQKLKMAGLTSMALNASNNSNLEQPALKGLNLEKRQCLDFHFWVWATLALPRPYPKLSTPKPPGSPHALFEWVCWVRKLVGNSLLQIGASSTWTWQFKR